jgi:methanogenic corrinoid protein MtbC1
LENSIKNYGKEAAVEATKKALKMSLDPIEIIEKGLLRGYEKWEPSMRGVKPS